MTATIPTNVTSTAAGFQPAFTPVITTDRHACALAAVATLASTTLEDVWKKAEELGLPKAGPYVHFIDGDFLAALLAKYSWVATVWKECERSSQLPDLCIAMVDYDADWEVGRHTVLHRAKCSHDAKNRRVHGRPNSRRHEPCGEDRSNRTCSFVVHRPASDGQNGRNQEINVAGAKAYQRSSRQRQ